MQNLYLITEIETSSCKLISIVPVKKKLKALMSHVVYTVTFPKYLLGLKLGMILNASFSSGYSIIGFNFESDSGGVSVAQ